MAPRRSERNIRAVRHLLRTSTGLMSGPMGFRTGVVGRVEQTWCDARLDKPLYCQHRASEVEWIRTDSSNFPRHFAGTNRSSGRTNHRLTIGFSLGILQALELYCGGAYWRLALLTMRTLSHLEAHQVGYMTSIQPAGSLLGGGGCTSLDKVLPSRCTEEQACHGSSLRHHCAGCPAE